ncbi:MAG: hypothetical protein ACLFU9_02640, partial [Candidatus Bathyarchaeia archaeon]
MHKQKILCLPQVGASRQGKTKNLAIVRSPPKESLAGGHIANSRNQRKLVEFACGWMEKQAYAKDTIRGYYSCLRALQQRNAD